MKTDCGEARLAAGSASISNGTLKNEIQVPLRTLPAYVPRKKLRIVTIGAGFSGLTLAHKLRYQHPEMENLATHTIFEAHPDIGGTWLMNSYPGVQCDVPAHIYAFPFDPNPDWSHFYASGPEILEYMRKTVRKWDLDRDILFNTRVTGAYWQEWSGQWKLTVEHEGIEREEYADILISAQGFLSAYKWPDIPGLRDFQGQLVHSAAWDHSYDYSHKRIAVIGNGSSAIQIIPALADLRGTDITCFQRGPTWLLARHTPAKLLGQEGTLANLAYSEVDKRRFRLNPREHNKYRKQLVHRINKNFGIFVKGSPQNKENAALARKQMAEKLNYNPELCEKLIPKFELGCRRISPGEGYLETFLRSNVRLTQSPIVKFTKNAVHTEDGKAFEVDVVVCATGFDVSYCPKIPVIGRGGVALAKKWSEEPKAYFSLACPDMPNYFIFTGPNAVVEHGSLIEGLGWAAEYMIKWIRKIAEEDIKSVAPKQSAVDDFVTYGDEIQRTLTWTGSCQSWYKKNRPDGRITATFPGSALLFKRMISEIRGEDFDVRYNSPNRFRFMGSGFTAYELDENNDLAWYVEK